MKCPHCTVEIYSSPKTIQFGGEIPGGGIRVDRGGVVGIAYETCPACNRTSIYLLTNFHPRQQKIDMVSTLIYPRTQARAPLSPLVPDAFARIYRQAAAVLIDSPMASAALSRRCLQHVLREVAGTTKKDLIDQIKEVQPSLPPALRKLIDAVRTIGNFAAHPMKSTNTGEIIEVEPGEAELLLDILDMAFDFYCVQPAEADQKLAAIEAKKAEAGKPPAKKP